MQRNSTAAGFTFIEIMVVVIIIGILATIIVPQLASRPDQARRVKVTQDILAIENALNLYRLDNSNYPTTDQGLLALVEKPTTPPSPSNWKPYLKQLPKDPWGQTYNYLNPGEHGEIDIFSYGANGQVSGEGINATVGNWVNPDEKA
jgi:general secretion pathway protein G